MAARRRPHLHLRGVSCSRSQPRRGVSLQQLCKQPSHVQSNSLTADVDTETWTYPLQEVSGFLCEVGGQVEFTLQDLVDGLFAVFPSERWLQRGNRSHQALHHGTLIGTSTDRSR